MDWRAGKEEKSKPTTREIEFNSGEGQQRGRGGIWGRVIAGMAGQGISYSILSSRNVNYIAGNLGNVG